MTRWCLTAVGMTVLVASSACSRENPQPVVLDGCESIEASRKTWEMTGVAAELSDEHVTGGKHSLKLTFSKDGGAVFFGSREKPLDWSGYKSICFDIYNAEDEVLCLVPRIDDAEATGFKDRFEPCDQLYLAPKRSTHVGFTLDDLQANNWRVLDTTHITRFNLHLSNADRERVLYVDSFRFVPLAAGSRPEPVPDATEVRVIDDAESPARSSQLWKASDAKVEVVEEHATEGKRSLRVTFPPSDAWPALTFEDKQRPMDWRGYKTFLFDVANPGDKPTVINVTIHDANTIDKYGRYVVDDIDVPPQKRTAVKLDIRRMVSLCGLPMDMGRITKVAIYTNPSKEAQVVHIDNIRLGVTAGGVRNEIRPGPIPGETPETLGRKLLEDPEIQPLVPVFRAIAAKRVAICSHSASITAHWSTSGAFFDVAAEAVRAVNPGFEYKGFHRGGMGAGTAVQTFLKEMIDYKPTDTYLLVVPSPMEAQQKLIDDMKAAGSRVFVFDAVKPWGAYPPKLQDELRKLCEDRGATFIELTARGYGAPGSYKWTTIDTIHMTTAGHMFYAKELLKEWAKIYAPVGGK